MCLYVDTIWFPVLVQLSLRCPWGLTGFMLGSAVSTRETKQPVISGRGPFATTMARSPFMSNRIGRAITSSLFLHDD